ncbi:MAG TPA: Wzz/FepE/Etk N-terminal domain-containing protein, partial [Nitrospira sp.]|nr:Wzz/FepE/Etk N-terminal domain-containing protein [Nitrospira sp.]
MKDQEHTHERDSGLNLQEYVRVFQRRRVLILTVTVVLLSASVAISLLLPPTFKSTATILIEEQEVP